MLVYWVSIFSLQNRQPNVDPADVLLRRRTPMACQFCRARKLKCDGRPTCANCSRRSIPCTYVPV
ncbi:hypothetical protein K474DRAFT_1593798 [Panus rudis PR-1116 ss-1]|nr:hypothetical protein K474DRAFT_1593798 [Panus rudis PR-1116 ss-1]